MEVNRRLFFGFLGGAAASGKSIALKAEEAFRTAKVKEILSTAVTNFSNETQEGVSTKSIPMKYTKNYFMKKLMKLETDAPKKNRYVVIAKRRIEIEELRSVSYSQKCRMISNFEIERDKEKAKLDILQNIKNIAAGRDYWDDGED